MFVGVVAARVCYGCLLLAVLLLFVVVVAVCCCMCVRCLCPLFLCAVVVKLLRC